VLASRTQRGLTLLALISRLSGVSRSAAIARVSRLAGIARLARRALLSRSSRVSLLSGLPRLSLWPCRTRHRRGRWCLVTPRNKQRQQRYAAQ
jgi:hypothetical protein